MRFLGKIGSWAEGIMLILLIVLFISLPGMLSAIGDLALALAKAGVAIFGAVPDLVRAALKRINELG